jgi:hypothetical protein
MVTINLAGTVLDNKGAAVSTATIAIFKRNTTTPEIGTAPTVDSNGQWSVALTPINDNTDKYDVQVTNGAEIRRLKYDDEVQLVTLEAAQFRIRNPADTYVYDIIPAAITADRNLTLPLITASDTLVALALAQTLTNKTLTTPTISATGFANANHAHAAGNSGGQVAITDTTGTLAVGSGGTGATSLTDGGVLLGSGTGAVTAMAVLADGAMIVGDGTTDPVAESGATLRTSIGVGTADSPTFAALTLDAFRVSTAGLAFINETLNGKMAIGLTLNQGTNTDEILALKYAGSDSGFNHGITTITEGDTYGVFRPATGTDGGLLIRGLSDTGNLGLQLFGVAGGAGDTAKTNSAEGIIRMNLGIKSNANIGTPGTNVNLVAIRDNVGGTKFIFDQEGSGHSEVEWITYAEHDDLELVSDMEAELLLHENEAQTARRHHLEETGIIGQGSWRMVGDKPKAMINWQRLAMLHHGTLLQVGETLKRYERAMQKAGIVIEPRSRPELT